MPLKTTLIIATTLGSVGDTSMADLSVVLQIVTVGQLQDIVDQFTNNRTVLENRINEMGMIKVKMPLIKKFSGEKVKLKGFLT